MNAPPSVSYPGLSPVLKQQVADSKWEELKAKLPTFESIISKYPGASHIVPGPESLLSWADGAITDWNGVYDGKKYLCSYLCITGPEGKTLVDWMLAYDVMYGILNEGLSGKSGRWLFWIRPRKVFLWGFATKEKWHCLINLNRNFPELAGMWPDHEIVKSKLLEYCRVPHS